MRRGGGDGGGDGSVHRVGLRGVLVRARVELRSRVAELAAQALELGLHRRQALGRRLAVRFGAGERRDARTQPLE